MGEQITAIIPVREGSRRLKNKNLAPFAGVSLLLHKIRQLQRTPSVTEIVVSSDSARMLEVATNAGVSTHVRPSEYADDISGRPWGETVAYVAGSVPGDIAMWCTVTSPLVDEGIFEAAIETFLDARGSGFDSLLTVTPLHEFLWDTSGPLNYALGQGHVPSQQLPELYRATFGVFVAERLSMVEWEYVHGPSPYRMVLGKRESVDVDDGLDLLCARAWLDADAQFSTVNPYDSTAP